MYKRAIILPQKRIITQDPRQYTLDVFVDKHTEIDGVGMGVLTDGTPFLNQRGLARLCGVENEHIGTISSQWSEEPLKPRIESIKRLLDGDSDYPDKPHYELRLGRRSQYCYPVEVSLAVLEYYAFEAGANCQIEARRNFRKLAGSKLRDLIYSEVGYHAHVDLQDRLSSWLARVELNRQMAPLGYFSVFNEAHTVIYELILAGAKVGPKLVPDISIGQHWRRHWDANSLETQFGPSQKCPHIYPDDHPQSRANPQDAWCYPNAALGAYRDWFCNDYLEGGKFANYLKGRVPTSVAATAIQSFGGQQKRLVQN